MYTRATFTRAAMLAAAPLLLGISACDDDDDDGLAPVEDVVITVRDEEFAFDEVQTFSIPDSLVHLAPTAGFPVALSREFDDEILARVRANLIARGYVENTDPENTQSDVVVLVGATAGTEYVAFQTYDWYSVWGWYPGWSFFPFDDSWTVSYPAAGVAEVNTGTIIVDMISTLSVNPLNRRVNSVWAGAGRGILDGSSDLDRVFDAIDEMFRQSPYLEAD